MNTECCTWVVNPGDKTIEDCYLLVPTVKAAVAHMNLCQYGKDRCGACKQSFEILWGEEVES